MAWWALGHIRRRRPPPHSLVLFFLLCSLLSLPFSSARSPSADNFSPNASFPPLRPASVLRLGRRLPSRKGAVSWMRLFGDMRLTELALPATIHSTLTDANDARYFEIAHAQNVGVAQQLKDGIRVLDVRPWRSQEYTGWYSEIPWRLDEDMKILRQGAVLPSPSSAASSPTSGQQEETSTGKKSEGESPKPESSKGQPSSASASSSEARESTEKTVPASPTPLNLIDIHSDTNLEESLFIPVQRFLRTNVNEVVVVVFSALNGNRHGTMDSVKHASSLGISLKHYLDYLQPGKNSEEAARKANAGASPRPFQGRGDGGSPPKYVEGHPGGREREPASAGTEDKGSQTKPASSLSSSVDPKAGGSSSTTTSDKPKDAGDSSPGSSMTLPYEVLTEDEISASYLSSAVRKPLLYKEVYELMDLIDRYWGALLPRHDHVFVGPHTTAATPSPGVSTPQKNDNDEGRSTASGEGSKDTTPEKTPSSSGSTLETGSTGGAFLPAGHVPYSRTLDPTRSLPSSAYDVYPMAESVNRPEVFASWLRRQGEMWLSEIPLREMTASRVQILLFVDDPLVAWFMTAFSREHVMVFVAGDHVYDISYKSESYFAPCGIPHRSGPIGDELSLTKVSTWMECRSACEALGTNQKTDTSSSSSPSSPQSSSPKTSPRGPCTHWTFGPVVPSESGASPSSSTFASAPRGVSQETDSAVSGSSSTSSVVSPPSPSSAYTTYQQPPPPSDCRTFGGTYTIGNLSVVPGAVTESAKCSAKTLLDDVRQWSAVALFEDLTDSVCPLIGPGISAKAMRPSRPFARELCLLDISGSYGLMKETPPARSRTIPPTNKTSESPRGIQANQRTRDAEDDSSAFVPRGLQVSKKLIRVHFSPASPLFFVDGTRNGKRFLGPADMTSGINRLALSWVLWHLDRQAFLENNLSAAWTSSGPSAKSRSNDHSVQGRRYPPAGSSSPRSWSRGGGRHAYKGGPVTRPVNALMLMRYDNLDRNTSDRGGSEQALNYFETIMHLNPLPPSAAALAMENELADFSAEHYIRLTALRNLDDLDENFFVTFWSGKKPNGRSPDDGATPMLWLVVCAAVLCLWAMLAAFFCSSTICWKRARIDGGRGWTVGPAVSGPGRGVVGSGSVIQAA